MTESQVKEAVRQLYGMDARLITTWMPKGDHYGDWWYVIGVQEYQGPTTNTIFGTINNPYAGQPLPQITIKGQGTTWQQAFDSLNQ